MIIRDILRPDDAYMNQWTKSFMICVMAEHMRGAEHYYIISGHQYEGHTTHYSEVIMSALVSQRTGV